MSGERRMTDEVESGTIPVALQEARGADPKGGAAAATPAAEEAKTDPAKAEAAKVEPVKAEPLSVAKVQRLEDLALMVPVSELDEIQVRNELALIGEPIEEVRSHDRVTQTLQERKRKQDEAHDAMITERASVKRRLELRASALGDRVRLLTTRLNRIVRDRERAEEEARQAKAAAEREKAAAGAKK